METTAAFDLMNPKNAQTMEKARQKVEQRLANDPEAKRIKITTLEQWVKFVQNFPEEMRKPQLMDRGYLQWILRLYMSGGIGSLSDMEHVWFLLDIFHAGKRNLEGSKRDINRFKHVSDLDEVVGELRSAGATTSKRKGSVEAYYAKAKELVDNNQARVVYNDPKLLVIQPRNYKASCILGMASTWCTGGGDIAKESYFTGTYKSEIFIVIRKDKTEKRQYAEKRGGSVEHLNMPVRYNFSFHQNEFADTRNHHIDPRKLLQEMPGLARAFDDQPEFNPNLSEGDAVKAVSQKNRANTIKYIRNPSDRVIKAAIKNGGVRVLEHVEDARISPDIQMSVVKNNPSDVEYLSNIDDAAAKYAIDKNPKIGRAHV